MPKTEKIRTGKFFHEIKEPRHITLEKMRGDYDPSLSSDCRCKKECYYCEMSNYCLIKPHVALSSLEAWGDMILSAAGLPDGDMPNPDRKTLPLSLVACDIYGRPYNEFDNDGSIIQEKVAREFFETASYLLLNLDEPEERPNEFDYRDYFALQKTEAENLNYACQADFQDGLSGMPDFLNSVGYFAQQCIVAEEIEPLENESEKYHYGERAWIYDNEIKSSPFSQSGFRCINDNWKSKKETRACSSHGSFSCGKRGKDLYKSKRTGKDRAGQRELQKMAASEYF